MISTLNVAYRIKESRTWFKVRAIALGIDAGDFDFDFFGAVHRAGGRDF